MIALPSPLAPLLHACLWLGLTLGAYAASVRVYRWRRAWWTAPLLVTWLLCAAFLLLSRTPYAEYFSGARWFVFLLGPATIAFALPVYRQRALIRRRAGLIAAGAVTGSLVAFGSGWALGRLLHLPADVAASLLPRSVTTPFAMAVSERIGGIPELTASLTAATGLFGAAVGEGLLAWLPLRRGFRSVACSLTAGAMLGMGAHGAGVARARERDEEGGAIAGLVMIGAGLLNVAGVALYVACFKR